jgi:hypothetical protein
MTDEYWAVPREWEGATAFLLGGGPSLRGFNAEVLRGRGRIIAINNSYILAPWADVLYYADGAWWKDHRERVLQVFRGAYRVSIEKCGDDTKFLRPQQASGLATDPTALRTGFNSGYQAINLAYHFGATRIVLLGYDLHVDGARTHWHAGHPGQTPEMQTTAFQEMFLPRFPTLVAPLTAAGVEVINATPGSALTCWPIMPLTQVLNAEDGRRDDATRACAECAEPAD